MIPDQQEVIRSIYGAWRLPWLDRSGMGHFNLSVDGFWRSFFAAVLVAPTGRDVEAKSAVGFVSSL